MQWILSMRSSTARSLERKWSTKYLEDDIPLVFRKPIWQLRACLASVLITPVLYRLYLIMVTICYILFNKPCKQFSCEWTYVRTYIWSIDFNHRYYKTLFDIKIYMGSTWEKCLRRYTIAPFTRRLIRIESWSDFFE